MFEGDGELDDEDVGDGDGDGLDSEAFVVTVTVEPLSAEVPGAGSVLTTVSFEPLEPVCLTLNPSDLSWLSYSENFMPELNPGTEIFVFPEEMYKVIIERWSTDEPTAGLTLVTLPFSTVSEASSWIVILKFSF